MGVWERAGKTVFDWGGLEIKTEPNLVKYTQNNNSHLPNTTGNVERSTK